MKENKTKKVKKEKHPLKTQRTIATILLVIVSMGVLGLGGFSIYATGVIKKAPELYAEDFLSPESTKIYASNNEEIYDTGLKIRENITYDELPQSLIDAFVAVEDSRFFEHKGFDVPRFTKAALENLFSSLRHGSISFGQGGSTFTMQLIKNTYFMYEDPQTGEVVLPAGGVAGIDRKIQEIYLSNKLERNHVLSKQLILELYLNMINFGAGNNILGIENSAEAYFGKEVSELSLVESAFLAGVINAPSVNNPYYSIKNATNRTHEVLYLMNYHGYITDEEYAIAKAVPLENLFVGDDGSDISDLPYQAYIDVVISEVKELTGLDPASTPMKIHTSMNLEVQKAIDEFQRREIEWLDQGKDTHIQVGSSVINNKTGEIVGVVGGYDYNGRLIHNRAKDSYHHPGSVIKPVVDYAPAFEYSGWSTTHKLVDEPWAYAGTDIVVGNYDDRYWGEITVMDAVADSRNVPALRAMEQNISTLGTSGMVEYLNKIGYSVPNTDNFSMNFALGGGDFIASPLEVAGSYTMLMNGGNYTQPHTVTRIEFSDGREPLIPQYTSIPVISDAAAYLTTRTMKYAVEGPYPGYLDSIRKGYTVFGKTGTTRHGPENVDLGIPKDSMKDRLMVAATSDFSMATWVGFDKNDPEMKPWFSPSEADFNLAGRLNSYLLDILAEEYGAPSDLEKPSGVVDFKHILGTFPYQIPLEDMNQDLIVTGMIKKEFLNLVEAKPQPLKDLDKQKVNVKQNGRTLDIDIELTPYPDQEKLKVAENKLVMKFPNGQTTTGKKLYDESWVFGAVRYMSEVRVNGKTVAEISNDQNKQTLSYQLQDGDKKIEICSFYTYEDSKSRKSNEKCTPVELSEISIDKPDNNLESITAWAEANGIPTRYVYKENNRIDRFNKLSQVSPDITKGKISMDTIKQLKDSGLDIELYDYTYTLGDRVAIEALRAPFPNLVIDNPDNNDRIIALLVGSDQRNAITHSQDGNSTITIQYERNNPTP